MWRRNTVVFTTWPRVAPSSTSRASRLSKAWRTSSLNPPETISPSTWPIWPETTSQSPALTMGVYAPTGLVMRSTVAVAGGQLRGAALVQPGGGRDRGEDGVGAVDGRAVRRLDHHVDL